MPRSRLVYTVGQHTKGQTKLMNDNGLTKEQRMLIAMRKTLAAVARDTAPQPGLRHPLSESTIEDIRHCLALISAREQEIAREQGREIRERPVFADEPRRGAQVVSLNNLGKGKKKPRDVD
jgi:hypothetical protein